MYIGQPSWGLRVRVPHLMASALAMLACAPVMAAIGQPARTQSGLVSGIAARDPAITVFKGIPYAAAPVGDLRWRAPGTPASWKDVRQADQFGPVCPQRQMGPPGAASSSMPMSEDCLSLNIWTQAQSAKERRPVFVWIYGGRFSGGSGSQPLFDGEGLARKGLVVVTFNYRLGVFGFLASPELSAESGHHASGNYGLLDQIAALRWVRKNIAAFGGDPHHVTIAGQSAGAGSVLLLSDSPLARGLFQAAIAESGARTPQDPAIANLATSWRSLPDAEREGAQYMQTHGAHSLKELRALSAERLLEGSNLNDTAIGNGYGNSPPPPLFRPVIDGWVVPLDYSHTWDRGKQAGVIMVTGGNRDESGAQPQPRVTLADYQAYAKKQYGALAGEYLKLYPAATDQEAGQASNAAARDGARVSTYLFAAAWKRHGTKSVYLYYWDHAPPGPDQARRGAYHESEINYVFNNLYATDRPWTDQDRRIAEVMSSYWANIAIKGDPNDRDLPVWIPYDPVSQTVMELGEGFGPMPIADDAKVDFWNRFYAAQKPW
jgi:para-nitrobenzyl esterase